MGRGYLRVPSMYPSVKTGRSIACEADHERALVEISEADPNVVTYVSQPHRLEIYLGPGRPLIYFPDLRRDLADGTVEIIETKKNYREVTKREAYERKLSFAERIYGRKGWQYRIMTAEQELGPSTLLSNSRVISGDRSALVETDDVLALQLWGTSEAKPTYGGAMNVIQAASKTNREQARAKLHALIVERLVHLDISVTLTETTPIRLVGLERRDTRRLRRRVERRTT